MLATSRPTTTSSAAVSAISTPTSQRRTPDARGPLVVVCVAAFSNAAVSARSTCALESTGAQQRATRGDHDCHDHAHRLQLHRLESRYGRRRKPHHTTQRGPGRHDAAGAAQRREHEAFGRDEPPQIARRGAHRRADGELARAPEPAPGEQVGHVDAGNRERGNHRGQQQPQRTPPRSQEAIPQRLGVRARMNRGIAERRLGDRVELRHRAGPSSHPASCVRAPRCRIRPTTARALASSRAAGKTRRAPRFCADLGEIRHDGKRNRVIEHADDARGEPFQVDGVSDDRRVAAETSRPDRPAQHHDRISAGDLVCRGERAAKRQTAGRGTQRRSSWPARPGALQARRRS